MLRSDRLSIPTRTDTRHHACAADPSHVICVRLYPHLCLDHRCGRRATTRCCKSTTWRRAFGSRSRNVTRWAFGSSYAPWPRCYEDGATACDPGQSSAALSALSMQWFIAAKTTPWTRVGGRRGGTRWSFNLHMPNISVRILPCTSSSAFRLHRGARRPARCMCLSASTITCESRNTAALATLALSTAVASPPPPLACALCTMSAAASRRAPRWLGPSRARRQCSCHPATPPPPQPLESKLDGNSGGQGMLIAVKASVRLEKTSPCYWRRPP